MARRVNDPKTRLLMEFFSKELGVKFVDENGEDLEWEPVGRPDRDKENDKWRFRAGEEKK